MADFVTDFPDQLLLDSLGDTVTHISLGAVSTEAKAVIEFDVASDEYATERQTEIELLTENFTGTIERNEQIIHNGTTYKLDRLIARNDNYQRWTMING